MTRCTKVLRFSAGHRLLNHEGRCAHLHGHNYRVEITCRPHGRALDAVGRVVDFDVVKTEVGGWIDEWWDHAFLVDSGDSAALELLDRFDVGAGQKQRVYRMPDNPTAENMARHLRTVANARLAPHQVAVVRVLVWETDTCRGEDHEP